MNYIYEIESSNNPAAYNKRSKATGLGQITPIALKQFNNRTGKKYSMDDKMTTYRKRQPDWIMYIYN